MMEEEKEYLSVGEFIGRFRREQGVGLQEISQATKISVSVLRAIENEDYSRLPSEVYVKGFIRTYADYMGMDVDEIIRRYHSSRGHSIETETVRTETVQTRKKPRYVILAAAAAMLFVGIGAVWFDSLHREPTPEGPVEASRERTALSEGASVGDPKSVQDVAARESTVETTSILATERPIKPTGKTAPPNPDVPDLFLKLSATQETWLKVIIDGEEPKEYMLKSGDKLSLEAERDFNLLVGNAGGIDMDLNGKPVYLDGKSGDVVTIRLP